MKRKELRKGFTGGLGRAVMMTVLTTALVFAGGISKDSPAGRVFDQISLSGVTAQAKLTATSETKNKVVYNYLKVDSLEAATDFDWSSIYEGEEVTDILSARELNLTIKDGSATYTDSDAIIRSKTDLETMTAAEGAIRAYITESIQNQYFNEIQREQMLNNALYGLRVDVEEKTAPVPYQVAWYECDEEGVAGELINTEGAEFKAGKYYYCTVQINSGYATSEVSNNSTLWIGRFTTDSTLTVDGCEEPWTCIRTVSYRVGNTIVGYTGTFKSPYIQAKNPKELTYYDEEYNGYTNTWFAGAYVGDTVKRPTVTAKKDASVTHITKVTTDIRY